MFVNKQVSQDKILSSNSTVKVCMTQIDKQYYFQKTIRGSKVTIQNYAYFLDKRMRDQKKKKSVFDRDYNWKVQRIESMSNENDGNDYCLNIFSKWIQAQDIISINSQNTSFFDTIGIIVSQLVAQLLIGPNDFFYTYENILFNNEKTQIAINYASFIGMELFTNPKYIKRKVFSGIYELLGIENFEKQTCSFGGLNIVNKFRAIAMMIMSLVTKQRINVFSDREESQKPQINAAKTGSIVFDSLQYDEVQKELSYRQQILTQLFEGIRGDLDAIDKHNQVNYEYFISSLLSNQIHEMWSFVIPLLIPQLDVEAHKDEKLAKAIDSIGEKLFNSEEDYSQGKWRELGIITNESSYELYLKLKLASNSEELIFLLSFQHLADIFSYHSQLHQKLIEDISKSFFALIVKSKRNTEQNLQFEKEEYEQNQFPVNFQSTLFSGQEQMLLNTLSKNFGIIKSSIAEKELQYRNSQGQMLKKYLNL